MSVWSRIKEHKVVQWTLGYAVAAYTLLHGVEMVGNAFTWPQTLVRIVTMLDRQQVSTAVSTEDCDDFIKNLLTMLTELRGGLAVDVVPIFRSRLELE